MIQRNNLAKSQIVWWSLEDCPVNFELRSIGQISANFAGGYLE
jgi:hypothetical protein